MGERYTRLFTLPKNCYVPGAPVLVEAGALLKDNAENKVIAQLKILNLQNKALKAVTVAFLPFDTTGKVLGKDFDYQYLDLNTKKNQTFGERTPVEFPNATTRAFLPAVMEVIFDDNSQWKVAPDEVWNPLPKQEPLDSALSNPILKVQYQKETTSEAAFRPEDLGEIWRCTCGAVNPSSNGNCRVCRASKTNVLGCFDEEHLRKNHDKEKEEREEYEKQQAMSKRKRTRKIALGGGIVAAVLAVILLMWFVIIPFARTNHAYNQALDMVENGQPESALLAFEALGSYKDSEEQIYRCYYELGKQYAQSGKVLPAVYAFIDSMGYEDSYLQIIDTIQTACPFAIDEYTVYFLGVTDEAGIDVFVDFGEGKSPQYMEYHLSPDTDFNGSYSTADFDLTLLSNRYYYATVSLSGDEVTFSTVGSLLEATGYIDTHFNSLTLQQGATLSVPDSGKSAEEVVDEIWNYGLPDDQDGQTYSLYAAYKVLGEKVKEGYTYQELLEIMTDMGFGQEELDSYLEARSIELD